MENRSFEERKKILLDFMGEDAYRPMRLKDLAVFLGVPRESREELKAVLDALMAEGKVGISSKGRYGKAEMFAPIGVFHGSGRGYGFVTLEGREKDIFIPKEATNGALDRDLVQIAILPGSEAGRSEEGKVLSIKERGTKELIGTFRRNKQTCFVLPDNPKWEKDIFVPVELSMGAVNGHKVCVSILNYGNERKKPEGRVKEILGHINDPGTDILSIARAYELPMEFSEDVMRQVQAIPEQVSPAEMEGRMDLRAWQTVTIDGEDAKDLDDAITLTREGGFFQLGVHIADVTHYVPEGSPLDREALLRGTSVYLVDRVIPMLPHRLSNGICSLNEGCDRLALSCLMKIDGQGNVMDYEIAETVIRVDRRMSYTAVRTILEHPDSDEAKTYAAFVPMFQRMAELSEIIRQKRYSRGAIDFDFPEAKIELDQKGFPVEIRPYERNVATKIIEDFMLLANETIAEDAFWKQLPFVYRIHERPDSEKMAQFAVFLHSMGYSIKGGRTEIHPKELQKVLNQIEGTPKEALISRVMLRSMKKARYGTESLGHYGLAANYYTHFTSPIRRYPDLQIHRILKETMHGMLTEKRANHYEQILQDVCAQSSSTERRAEEAERETEKLKKVQYMSRHKFQRLEGIISGVTRNGFFVELPNTVEGMVSVRTLDDFYTFQEETYTLVPRNFGPVYHLGDRVEVVAVATNPIARTIDFEIYEEGDWYEFDGENWD